MTLLDVTPRTRVPVLDAVGALAAADDIAAELAAEAGQRDAERELPARAVERLSETGLLAVTVPAVYGGADLAPGVLAEVVARLATGDPNVAQLPHSHFVYVNALRRVGTDRQRELLFGQVLRGARFGNAQSETGTKHVRDLRAVLSPGGPGQWRLDAVKGYCTGALFAHWIPVLAHLVDLEGPLHVAWVQRHADGVTVTDDWDGMGQRTTASGTVRLDGVSVPDELVTPWHRALEGPQVYGAFAQLLHAAIDAGIARAALADAAQFVTHRSRPYPDAAVERAADDPLVVQAVGQIVVQVRGSDALLAEAGRAVDRAFADLNDRSATEASLAVAAARVTTTDVCLSASSRLFEVAGTRSALDSLNLHRHWRNARTHTLHDPAGWKVQHLGRHALDGVAPPNHAQI